MPSSARVSRKRAKVNWVPLSVVSVRPTLRLPAGSCGLRGEILKRIHEAGFQIVTVKSMRLLKAEAEGFYAVHRLQPFFASLAHFMSSGKVVVLALEAENAIAKWREVMGATDLAQAALGTIRKEFDTSIQNNCTHGSDGPETAAFEISFFFPSHELLQLQHYFFS